MRKVAYLLTGAAVCVVVFIICFGRTGSSATNAYTSFLEFPYNDMDVIDETAFLYIQKIYSELDFCSNFVQGGESKENLYKDVFRCMLNNEIPFTNGENGEEVYLSDYHPLLNYDGNEYVYDAKKYLYAFFDMDLDGAPELCMLNGVESAPTIMDICIFKYQEASGKITLWWEQSASSYYYIYGSRQIGWEWQGGERRGFYLLKEDGTEEMAVFFLEDEVNGAPVYMATLPRYADIKWQEELPEEIETQLYYDSGSNLYYCKVTKAQYDELIGEFLQESENAKEHFAELMVTYDELFAVN